MVFCDGRPARLRRAAITERRLVKPRSKAAKGTTGGKPVTFSHAKTAWCPVAVSRAGEIISPGRDERGLVETGERMGGRIWRQTFRAEKISSRQAL